MPSKARFALHPGETIPLLFLSFRQRRRRKKVYVSGRRLSTNAEYSALGVPAYESAETLEGGMFSLGVNQRAKGALSPPAGDSERSEQGGARPAIAGMCTRSEALNPFYPLYPL